MIAAFSAKPDAIRVAYLAVPTRHHMGLLCLDPDEQRKWFGDVRISPLTFWTPPVTPEQIADELGSIESAMISVWIRTASDQWGAASLFLFWDPFSNAWRLANYNVNNNVDILVSPVI